jgi:uncharacterized membrane protein YcgQ (UPF0703/DUF1980 family)
MDHEHASPEDPYFLDQLCTVAICGAIGGVALMMWYPDAEGKSLLATLLHPRFVPFVLYGGIVLLILTLIRAVTLWFAAAPAAEHVHEDHDHDHEHHDHDHSHAHSHSHSHSHGHDHDHGWNPWRYAVLLLPVVLFFLNLPPSHGFSADYLRKQIASDPLENNDLMDLATRGNEVLHLQFTELDQAAAYPDKREFYEGKIGLLKGQYLPGNNDRECSLVRLKIFCCAQDVIPLRVKILAPESLGVFKPMEWVEVEGQIQFRKRKGRDEFVPVLQLRSAADIRPTQPDANMYLTN